MPRPRGRTKEIRCYISPASAKIFAEHFPARNSFSWALQVAVDATLALVDGTPTTETVIRDAIRSAVITQRLNHKANGRAEETTGQDGATNDRVDGHKNPGGIIVEPIDNDLQGFDEANPGPGKGFFG